MVHLSRLLAAICAAAAILFSPPSNAGVGDKDLPRLNGEKTRLLYTVVGVADLGDLATSFHCTSTERMGGKAIQLGIEVFDYDGDLGNNVAVGEGSASIQPGWTLAFSTRNTVAFADASMNTGSIAQGSARIFATSKNVLCSAMIVDAVNDPPTSMVMLPVFKATKQGGM